MLLQLLGRLHIVFLHLPIGILLLAALLEWMGHWKTITIPRQILTLHYAIGSISALITCITGYILSCNGDYADEAVNYHMWAGIAATVISALLCWLSYRDTHQFSRWGAVVLVLAIMITGHLGGTITHGEGFLTGFSENENEEAQGPEFHITNIKEAQLYPDLIKPILDSKCVNCHGPSKKKGKLRLDTEEFILTGGKSGKAIIGASPENSELIHRIQLPASDKKHMPPKNKLQITSDELQLINYWVDSDSPFDINLNNLPPSDSNILQLAAKIVSDSKINDPIDQSSVMPATLPLSDLAPPSSQIMDELMELDIVALNAGKDSPFLEINLVNVSEIEPKHWAVLEKIAPHIVRLKLSGLKITDSDLNNISKMTNLMRLFLDETMITDDGLIHLSKLSILEYLNINNTSITDAGINTLNPLGQLKIIYAFQTNISIGNLTNGAKIEKGGFKLPMLESDTTRIPQY